MGKSAGSKAGGGGGGGGKGRMIVTEENALGGARVVENNEFKFVDGQDGLLDKETGRRLTTYAGKFLLQYKDRMGNEELPMDAKFDRYRAFLEKSKQMASESKPSSRPSKERVESTSERADRKQKERNYDKLYNEGGEGYNPYRD